MRKISLVFSIVLMVIFFFMTSCEKEKDTQKPVIQLHEPAEGDTLWVGQDVHFEADFSDDKELKAWKVDIHNDFYGHGHKSSFSDAEPWLYTHSWNFESGMRNSHVHTHDIVVPTEVNGKPIATGPYHVMVYCTDAAGNESWTVVKVQIAHK